MQWQWQIGKRVSKHLRAASLRGWGGSLAKRNSQNGRRQSYHHKEEFQVGKDLFVIRRYNWRLLRPLNPGTYQASGLIIPVTNRHRSSLWASWHMDQHRPHPSPTNSGCTCTALPCRPWRAYVPIEWHYITLSLNLKCGGHVSPVFIIFHKAIATHASSPKQTTDLDQQIFSTSLGIMIEMPDAPAVHHAFPVITHAPIEGGVKYGNNPFHLAVGRNSFNGSVDMFPLLSLVWTLQEY